MKVSTVLFASILAICLTVGYVSGQVRFPDGSEQTTAFSGSIVIDEGEELWIEKTDTDTTNTSTTTDLSATHVFGFYRDK